MTDSSAQTEQIPAQNTQNVPVISEENSKRITALRFFLILFVVLNHNYDAIYDFLHPYEAGGILNPTFFDVLKRAPLLFSSFALAPCTVPLFFIFTSYFQNVKHYPYAVLIKKKLSSLAIPYASWFVIAMLLQIVPRILINVFFPSLVSDPTYIPYISKWDAFDWIKAFTGYNFQRNEPFLGTPYIVPFWFLRDLIILTFISPLIRWISDRAPVLFFSALAVNFCFFQKDYFFLLENSVFFYTVGLYLAKYREADIFAFADKVTWLELCPVMIVSWYYFIILHQPPAARAVSVLSSGLAYLKISKYLVSKQKLYDFLAYASKYVFFVYAFHKPLLMRFVNKAFHVVIKSESLPALYMQYFTVGLGTFAIGFLAAICVSKLCPKFFKILNGGR